MRSVYYIPSPMSLPWLVLELTKVAPAWFRYYRMKGKRPEPPDVEDLLTYSLPNKKSSRMQRRTDPERLMLLRLIDEKWKAEVSERKQLDQQRQEREQLRASQAVRVGSMNQPGEYSHACCRV